MWKQYKFAIVFAWLVLISTFVSAVPIGSCGTLSANTEYTMNASISTTATCFTFGGNNITLDCAGFNIDGNNGAGDYGIFVAGRTDAVIRNCNVTDMGVGLYLYASSSNVFVYNSYFESRATYGIPNGMGIMIYIGGTNYYFENVTARAQYGRALMAFSGVINNITFNNSDISGFANVLGFYTSGVTNIYAYNTQFSGVYGSGRTYLIGANNSWFEGNNFSNGDSYGAVLLLGQQQNITFKNNVFNGTQAGLYFYGIGNTYSNNQYNITVYNNTFYPSNQCELILGVNASDNTFYANNFSGVGCHIINRGINNLFNTSEGNIYQPIENGSISASGAVPSSFYSNLFVATDREVNETLFSNIPTSYIWNQTVTANSTGNLLQITGFYWGFVFNTTTPTTVTAENLTGTITITPYAIGSQYFNLTTNGANSGGWITIPAGIYENRRIIGVVDSAPLTPTYSGVASSCIYAGGSNWVVDCSENCSVTSSYDLGKKNITFNGSGFINVQRDLFNWSVITVTNLCRVDITNSSKVYS